MNLTIKQLVVILTTLLLLAVGVVYEAFIHAAPHLTQPTSLSYSENSSSSCYHTSTRDIFSFCAESFRAEKYSNLNRAKHQQRKVK
jgi:hypothetical protein